MAINYTPIPNEFLEEMGDLSDEEYGRLIRWCQTYTITGEMDELHGPERLFRRRCKMQMDRYLGHYEEISQKRSKARRKSTNDIKSNQMISNDITCCETKTETKTETNTETNNSPPNGGRVYKRFTPPTLAEVQSYVAERHSPVDPQGFLDFYASKGWMVGKTPMKDWKAACRNAEKWERWSARSEKKRNSADYLLNSIMEDLQHDGNGSEGLPVSYGSVVAELPTSPERGGDDGGGEHMAQVFWERAGESGFPDDHGNLR